VVLTGYASAESAVETLNLAIDAYLLKPFASVDVLETIEDVLARAPAASPAAPHRFDVDAKSTQPQPSTQPPTRRPQRCRRSSRWPTSRPPQRSLPLRFRRCSR
jgi:DNA-binding response OmpR family regulator